MSSTISEIIGADGFGNRPPPDPCSGWSPRAHGCGGDSGDDNVLGPLALRTFRSLQADLITSQVSFTLQPRVFDERFPSKVLYVNDVTRRRHAMAWRISGRNCGEGGSR